MRSQLKQRIPEPAAKVIRTARDVFTTAGESPSAYFHPWRVESIRRIKAMKNTHPGERCFIIGNGPSLKNTDLQKLRGEFTIGLNRFYMAFPELGFTSSVLLTINDLVIEQCAEDLHGLTIPTFVSWRGRKFIPPSPNLSYLYTSYVLPHFSKDASQRLWEGATVTYVAMQLAYHMGFQQVILIGVDHNFVTKGIPNATVVSSGDDPNHFNPGYFGKGFRWQLPDLETSETGYKMAREAYKKDRREILDATIDGKLTIFPKVDYSSLFS